MWHSGLWGCRPLGPPVHQVGWVESFEVVQGVLGRHCRLTLLEGAQHMGGKALLNKPLGPLGGGRSCGSCVVAGKLAVLGGVLCGGVREVVEGCLS